MVTTENYKIPKIKYVTTLFIKIQYRRTCNIPLWKSYKYSKIYVYVYITYGVIYKWK